MFVIRVVCRRLIILNPIELYSYHDLVMSLVIGNVISIHQICFMMGGMKQPSLSFQGWLLYLVMDKDATLRDAAQLHDPYLGFIGI